MQIEGPQRRWHSRLREALTAAGHTLVLRRTAGLAVGRGLGFALTAERLLRRRSASLFEAIDEPLGAGESDLELELRFDGIAGDRALVTSLLACRTPRVSVHDAAYPSRRPLASGLPAIEMPDVLSSAFDHVLARSVQLVVEAVRSFRDGSPAQSVSESLAARRATSAPLFVVRALARRRRRLWRAATDQSRWRIAVRASQATSRLDLGTWGTVSFTVLPHDETRFEADPFVVSHQNRTCLFFEDFSLATRKGVIACRERLEDGGWSPPRIVLEESFHLSYPHVFVCDGVAYMLPETAAARQLRLYRAAPFPHRWIADRVLADRVEANDATLVEHEGRWWLFATISDDGSSSWDALGLWCAPHPLGPWTAHRRNPVLIDAGAARPAGEMWHDAGILMRVAQDCRAGYGRELVICRVDRLDPTGFAQTVVARLGPPAGLAARGTHTLNRAAGLEVIDLG